MQIAPEHQALWIPHCHVEVVVGASKLTAHSHPPWCGATTPEGKSHTVATSTAVPFCNIVRQLSLATGFCDGNEDKEAEVGKHQAENEATDADPNRGATVVLGPAVGLLIASPVGLNLLITCQIDA